MNLNLQNFELNLVQREEGMPIGFCWADDRDRHRDCIIEVGDTVTLRAKSGIEEDFLMDNELRVRVEMVKGNVIEGLLDMNDGAHDKVRIAFNKKYVQSCGKV